MEWSPNGSFLIIGTNSPLLILFNARANTSKNITMNANEDVTMCRWLSENLVHCRGELMVLRLHLE